MSYLVRDFYLTYASKMFRNDMGRGAYIQDVAGVKDAGGIELDPLHTTNGSASENGHLAMAD
jgi:hypothetical protein